MALGRLRSHGAPDDLPVIIEKTSGLIVDPLLEAGHPAMPVRPAARREQAPLALPAATFDAMVNAHIQQLRTLQAAIAGIKRLITDRAAAHPRARPLRDLSGVGMINLTRLLAEVGPILDRTASAEQAATECGAAPVTRASGKTTVYFR